MPRRSGTSVGVVSDTHGLVRPETVEALRGCDLIIHAGDIGKPEVLDRLRDLAPVVAIRGNNDRGEWSAALSATDVVEVEEARLYVVHDLADLDVDPAAAGFSAIISGHSHRPSAQLRCGILYLNPGSAGPRRFSLPVSVARLAVRGANLTPELVALMV